MRFGSLEKVKENINVRESYITEVRAFLGQLYNEQPNPQSRYEEMMGRVTSILKNIGTDILPVAERAGLKTLIAGACAKRNKKEFVSEALEALMPLIILKEKYPKELEAASVKATNELQGYTELNRLVVYDKSGPTISLHHSEAHTIGPSLRLYYDAMKKLAKIIEEDPEIEDIEAVSWIVADAPDLFTKNGFDVTSLYNYSGNSRNSFKKIHKEDKVARAHISREDFLNRFLEKK